MREGEKRLKECKTGVIKARRRKGKRGRGKVEGKNLMSKGEN